ncbi:MAG: diacylglycerol/lipid kinase family protein [Alphaproteobacteria bacterium]
MSGSGASSGIHAIVNPRSAGGRTGRDWPEIKSALRARLGPLDASFTDGPMHAAALTASALKAGADLILSVGGDGTLNECVNGFFENGEALNAAAELGVITSGTGGDFRKTFDIGAGPQAAIERLANGNRRRIDAGRLTFTGDDGGEVRRYFINIASFGLSGEVDRAVNRARIAKWFGGRFAFAWCSFTTLLSWRGIPVRLRIDDAFDETVNLSTVALCNGNFFGGGMQVAPRADPSDGLFDVVIMEDTGPWRALRNAGAIYEGRHVEQPSVRVLRGERIRAAPVDPARHVLLDIDGEAPGRLPVECEVLPDALTFRC